MEDVFKGEVLVPWTMDLQAELELTQEIKSASVSSITKGEPPLDKGDTT